MCTGLLQPAAGEGGGGGGGGEGGYRRRATGEPGAYHVWQQFANAST